jgi:predicted kinase
MDTRKRFVVALIGAVGSGKSLVSSMLRGITGAVIISSDEVRVAQKEFTEASVREEVARRLEAALKDGNDAILDADFIDAEKREALIMGAQKRGVAVYFLRVHADLDVTIARAIANTYDGGPKDIFSRAPTLLTGTAQSRGQAVKIREMFRRIPHHYTWSADKGGTWTLDLPPADHLGDGLIGDIDTTDMSIVPGAVKEAAGKIK